MTRDLRQTIDWVAKGRYSIGLGVRPAEYQEYKRAGAPVTNLVLKEASYLLGGLGFVSYLDKAPNPNASAIFLNWLLSKRGQTKWVEIRVDQSARIDIPLDYLKNADMPIRMERVDYFDTRNEEWELGEDKQKAVDLHRQVFTPLLR